MTSRKDFNTGYSRVTPSSGMFRAEVVEADTQYLKVRVPRLGVQGVFENVPYFGIKPAVGETIIVGLLEGNSSSPVAITPSPYGETPGGGSSVGGSDTQVQYNNSGVLAGSANMTFDGTSLNVAGLKLANTAVTSTAAELNLLDGITAGTVSASLAVIVDSNKDITGFRNVTLTGELDAATLDISGDADIDGTTNLDVVDIDGETTITHSTGNYVLMGGDSNEQIKLVSDNNSGRPYIAFHNQDASGNLDRKGYIGYPHAASDTSRIYIRADQGVIDMSATEMTSLTLSGNADFNGDLDVDGTANLDVVDIDGAVDMASTLTVNGHTFLGDHVQTGRTSFVVEPWSNSTIALGAFGGIGTQGSYRTSLSWNWERGTDSAFHHLDINSYPQAGAVEIGDGGILFEFDDDYETTHTTHPVIRARITSAGLILGSGTTGPILSEGSANTLRIETGDGYIDIGAMNASAEHIYASASTLFLGVSGNAEARLTSSQFSPASDEGLDLGSQSYTWNKFWLGQAAQFSSGGYYTLRSRDSDRQVMELVSSERFKKDIVDLPLSEAYKVLDARVIKYRGAEDDSSVPLEVGLSAESLHNAGYEYAVRYDEGHWGTTPRSIYYEYLTAPLIAIIKDLKARIEVLES